MPSRNKLISAIGIAAVLVLLVGAIAAAFRDNGEHQQVEVDDVVEVYLDAVSFEPEELEIPAGTTVRFVNRHDIEHDIVQTTPDELHHGREHGHQDDSHGHDEEHGHGPVEVSRGFHSPHLHHAGETWEATFTEPGEYPILCTVNDHYKAGMVGTIIVTEN
jgi:plastocyanin